MENENVTTESTRVSFLFNMMFFVGAFLFSSVIAIFFAKLAWVAAATLVTNVRPSTITDHGTYASIRSAS